MSLFSTIICCVNLTENSQDIVQYTKDIAKIDNAKILVAHSLPSTDNLRNYITSPMVEEVLENSKERTRKFLEEFVAANFQGFNAEPVMLSGNPARELLELVDKRCADLVIMGSMSTKGFFSFLFSRPSESVIGNTRVPVMVIPNDLSLECTPPEDFYSPPLSPPHTRFMLRGFPSDLLSACILLNTGQSFGM